MLSIRPASEKDIHRITEIYNEAIQNTTATFDTDIKTIEDRLEWFRGHDEKHPVLVAEFEGRVIGFASLTRWSDRCAYDGTAEVSLYVDHNYRGRGTGKQDCIILYHASRRGTSAAYTFTNFSVLYISGS
jgi:phosphinothricin acetyltransferase